MNSVMKLPPIPAGYRLLESHEDLLPGDMWSYESRLDIHRWLPCKTEATKEPQREYNKYIRKIDVA